MFGLWEWTFRKREGKLEKLMQWPLMHRYSWGHMAAQPLTPSPMYRGGWLRPALFRSSGARGSRKTESILEVSTFKPTWGNKQWSIFSSAMRLFSDFPANPLKVSGNWEPNSLFCPPKSPCEGHTVRLLHKKSIPSLLLQIRQIKKLEKSLVFFCY